MLWKNGVFSLAQFYPWSSSNENYQILETLSFFSDTIPIWSCYLLVSVIWWNIRYLMLYHIETCHIMFYPMRYGHFARPIDQSSAPASAFHLSGALTAATPFGPPMNTWTRRRCRCQARIWWNARGLWNLRGTKISRQFYEFPNYESTIPWLTFVNFLISRCIRKMDGLFHQL